MQCIYFTWSSVTCTRTFPNPGNHFRPADAVPWLQLPDASNDFRVIVFNFGFDFKE